MWVIEIMLQIASGRGTIMALCCGLFFAALAYIGSRLTHEVSVDTIFVAWLTAKGFVFGTWLAYTPFAMWSIVKFLCDWTSVS